MKRLIAVTLAAGLVLSSCGLFGADGVSQETTAFCDYLIKTAETTTSSHDENPAAITNPTIYKSEQMKALEIYETLIAKAPEEVKDELQIFLDNAIAMNKIYEKYGYDLVAMSKNPEAQKELAIVSSEVTAVAAKDRYQTFLTNNCDFDAN